MRRYLSPVIAGVLAYSLVAAPDWIDDWLSGPHDMAPRDSAVTGLPEAGPLRIVAFGTSLTAPPQNWPDGLAEVLTACRAAPVTVTRVAGPGMGSDWALGHVGEVVAQAPDVVLIEFAINDADLKDGVSLAQGAAQHQALIEALKAALPEAKLILMTMNPAQGPRGWIRPFLADHYAKTVSIAAENGVFLVDHYARWRALSRDQRGLEADGLHPDPQIASSIILPTLLPALGCDLRPANSQD